MRTPRKSTPRKRGRTFNDIYNYAGTAVRLYKKFKSSGSYTKTKSKARNGRIPSGTVTQQHDVRNIYSKKSMPKGKKRKWKRFVQKVKAVEASGRGNQSLVINDRIFIKWKQARRPAQIPLGTTNSLDVGIRYQGVFEVGLYTANCDAGRGGRDKDLILNEVSNNQTGKVLDTALFGMERPIRMGDDLARLKVPMNSARIDITYSNTSDYVLEVDMYTISHRKMKNVLITPPSSLINAAQQYNEREAQGLYYNVDSTSISNQTQYPKLEWKGCTPFQCPGLAKYAGASVLNKTKCLIGPGQSITRQYNDNRHRNIYSHDGSFQNRYDQDTITYLAIAKAPAAVLGDLDTKDQAIASPESYNSTAPDLGLVVSFTKFYSWTQEGVVNKRQSYFESN